MKRRITRIIGGLLIVGILATIALIVVTSRSASATTGVNDTAADAGIAQTSQSFDTLVFDYDADGHLDFLYSPQNAAAGRQLWHSNGDGTYTLAAHLKSASTNDMHGCATGDFDHNGQADIFCTMGAIHGSRTKADPVWLQQPDHSFMLDESAGLGGTAIDPLGRGYTAITLDANNDGNPDLFLDNLSPRPDGQPTPNRLYLNAGFDPVSGAWLGFQDAGAASGLEVEGQGNRGCDFTTDLNHDGNADIVFCGQHRMYFYEGDGLGHFTDASKAVNVPNFFAADAKLADINSDAIPDLVYIRAGQEGVRLGRIQGGFAGLATLTHAMTAGRAVETTDINGDGITDIYALQGNGPPGCTMSACPTNRPDYLYLGGTDGKYTETLIPQAGAGSGDTVDAIGSGLIVANGANLTTGPLQLLTWTP